MSDRWQRSYGAIAVALMFAFLAGCTSSAGATPTSESTKSAESEPTTVIPSQTVTTISSSEPITSTAQTTAPTTVSAETTVTSEPQSNLWPADLTPDQVVDAQAALQVYAALGQLIDEAFAKPAQDWTQQVVQYVDEPARSSLLTALSETANRGQYRSGHVSYEPQVTKVDHDVITINSCVDSTAGDFFDKNGVSIRAPNVPGSFWRHPATVTLLRYNSKWFVVTNDEDWSSQC